MKAVITGASRGIGRAICDELAGAGMDLLMVAKNERRLRTAAEEVGRSASGTVEHFPCDLSRRDAIAQLATFESGSSELPSMLVLNAGIYIEGDLTTGTDDAFAETMNINLTSAFHCVRALLPRLRKAPRPRIVLIGSTASHEPYPLGSLYGVSKWALRGLAINLREELKPSGIGVTLVTPGGTLTDLWAGEDLPEKRLLEPHDVARLVAVLCNLSDQAVVEEIIVRPMLGDIHS